MNLYKMFAQITGNAVSEVLNFKIFRGRTPPNPLHCCLAESIRYHFVCQAVGPQILSWPPLQTGASTPLVTGMQLIVFFLIISFL